MARDRGAGQGETDGAVQAHDDGVLNPIRTVGDLRRLIAGCLDEMPVRVHHGWDLPIVESGFDDDGTVLLFVDDSEVAAVNRQWLEKEHPE